LATDTREVELSDPDTPCTKSHYLRDISVAPDGGIDSSHARFQYQCILCVQGDIATEPPLMKEVLGNQKNTDIPVMATFRK
jgi:hypothetical protein